MRSILSSSLTTFGGTFQELLDMIKNDEKEKLTTIFPTVFLCRERYVDDKGDIKIGVFPCRRWKSEVKIGKQIGIGYIDLVKIIEDLKINLISQFGMKKVNTSKENYRDNLFYIFSDFVLCMQKRKNRMENSPYKEHEKIEGFNTEVKKFCFTIKDLLPHFSKSYENKYLRKLKGSEVSFETSISDIINRTNKMIRFFQWNKKSGRPPKPFNVLVFHLSNKLTLWKRDENRQLIYDGKGEIRQKIHWDAVCYVLLYIHFRIYEFDELRNMADRLISLSAVEGWALFKNRIRSIRSNFKKKRGISFIEDHYDDGLLLGYKEIFIDKGTLKGDTL